MNSLRYKISSFIGKGLIGFLERVIVLFIDNKIYLENNQFPWIKNIEENSHLIQDEFKKFYHYQNQQVPDICDISEEQYQVVDRGEWKFIPLYSYGIENTSLTSFFPETVKLIKTIPRFTTVFFSVLQPNMDIASHRGAYKGYLRYHLGVRIPQDYLSCGINIEGEVYHWENGKSVVFDDTFQHFAWNHSEEYRAVLYVDFIRPMPRILIKISKGLTYLISQSLYIQNAVKRLNKFEKEAQLVK